MMDTLVSAVGRARAKELVYSARVVRADEAKVFVLTTAYLEGDRTEKTNNET
eukprot:COSAG05_NODE_622_length_8291_cov_19.484985_2_plen_52_part_00